MKVRLKVIKTDGSREEYLHTKVMHTISNALECVGETDIIAAENLSEVITYYLYNRNGDSAIPTTDILSVIKVTLTATGHEAAAQALTDYDYHRRLRRNRIEVVYVNLEKVSDAHNLFDNTRPMQKSPWDKSVIVEDLLAEKNLDHGTTRTIAAMVEERIFRLDLTVIPSSLVKQLVLSSLATIMRAQRQLQTA